MHVAMLPQPPQAVSGPGAVDGDALPGTAAVPPAGRVGSHRTVYRDQISITA